MNQSVLLKLWGWELSHTCTHCRRRAKKSSGTRPLGGEVEVLGLGLMEVRRAGGLEDKLEVKY